MSLIAEACEDSVHFLAFLVCQDSTVWMKAMKTKDYQLKLPAKMKSFRLRP